MWVRVWVLFLLGWYIFLLLILSRKETPNSLLFFTGKIYYRQEMNTRTTAGEKRKEKSYTRKTSVGLVCVFVSVVVFVFVCLFCFCRGRMSRGVMSQGITSQLEMSRGECHGE